LLLLFLITHPQQVQDHCTGVIVLTKCLLLLLPLLPLLLPPPRQALNKRTYSPAVFEALREEQPLQVAATLAAAGKQHSSSSSSSRLLTEQQQQQQQQPASPCAILHRKVLPAAPAVTCYFMLCYAMLGLTVGCIAV
jgi:hypothetical protein